MEKDARFMATRMFNWGKYLECLIPHREELVKAVIEKDLCTIWKYLDLCKIPCEERWDIIAFIMEQAEKKRTGGPHWW